MTDGDWIQHGNNNNNNKQSHHNNNIKYHTNILFVKTYSKHGDFFNCADRFNPGKELKRNKNFK